GKMYWKSDTSSDEIDGHFMAFYTYFEHIAKNDPAEKELCIKQCRELIDYIVDNNYQLIDWDGERTRWGFWNPEALNGDPGDYIENGLNALQILSFLRPSHYITGDAKYLDHYKKLIMDHHYLSNVLTSKKEWPDENNHSDDQLGHVAWYPLLQTEKDPVILRALTQGIRRHYRIVWAEKPSFYTFVYATVDPHQADIPRAIENLQEIPTDRRTWEQKNMHRADVTVSWRPNRFGRPVLTRALPADERIFEKWNADPYVPDDGGDGRVEDDGAAYLLPYWMGRYHGFISESQ
ncbi:MAG TPA: transcriptional regulator, partial [Candidatus Hydrogenedentes bacterium]|nr:transcriptional regulator [Candidatus Hydrogenedentota bacterium]